MIDLHRILFLFALSSLAAATISGPMGYCLGNCANCDPYALSKCKGLKACQWGYYDPSSNGNCQIVPSLTVPYNLFRSIHSSWAKEPLRALYHFFQDGA